MRLIGYLILLLLFTNVTFAQKEYTGQSIEDILELKESEINIGIASLVLAKEFYPNLNVPFFLYSFDFMANQFKHYFGNYTKPKDRIGALNTYLYKAGYWNNNITFSYDFSDLFAEKVENRFINYYIANKKGSCVTMPMLYIILAERLGYPIYASRAPLHYFARYLIVDSTTTSLTYQNIEATSKGGVVSDKKYIENDSIPENAISNGVYLRTLTKKEYLATLLADNAYLHYRNRDIKKAKHFYEVAISYDSTLSGAYWNYSYILYDEAVELENKLKNEVKTIESSYFGFQHKREPKLTTRNLTKQTLTSVVSQSSEDYVLKDVRKPKQFHYDFKRDERTFIQTEMLQEIREKENKYIPQIKSKLKKSKRYKKKAKELGIVLQPLIEFKMKEKSMEKNKKGE